MGTVAKPTRENRTITVDFRDEATYFRLIKDGKAFVEFVLAFLLSLGFQLKHQAKPGQHRLCWLTQKPVEKRADKKRSQAGEIASMSMVTRTPLALAIGHRDLTNRVGHRRTHE